MLEKQRQRKLGFLFVAILLLAVIGRGCVFRPSTHFPGAHFNRGKNATWLGVEWVNKSHSESEIAALGRDLRQRQIRSIYVFTTYLKPDGTFNPTFTYAADFVRSLKAAEPNLNVQAWIGLPLQYVNLRDENIRQQVAILCANIIQAGFDGVHLDPEPVRDGDANVLILLDEIRNAIGAEPIISLAARRIQPLCSETPLVGQIAWSADYYRQAAQRVDQLAVMIYDSGLPLPQMYRLWGRFQVIETTQAIRDIDVELFFGVPTSEEKTWTHWPAAENMTSGLQGVVDGLNDAEAHSAVVAGVAIYPYWETDAAEWSAYESLWLGQ